MNIRTIAPLITLLVFGLFNATSAHAVGPTFTGTLSLSGTPQDGQTLTVTGSDPTNWKVQPCGSSRSVVLTVSYTWQKFVSGRWMKAANTTNLAYVPSYTIWPEDGDATSFD